MQMKEIVSVANNFFSRESSFISQEFIWNVLDKMFKKNLIYRSNEYKFHSIQ